MYGREKELHSAKNLFEQLPAQRVCALFIGGEPGSGKSSFVNRFLSQLNENALHGSGKFEQVPYSLLLVRFH